MEKVGCARPVVLVVDDDGAVHAALRVVLEDDYEMISASSGEAGLKELERRRVDVLMLDLLMPGTDGWEVFEQLRRMDAGRPKVMFLTGVDSSVAAVAAIQLGADDWILKPFDVPALLLRLQSLVPPRRPLALTGGDIGARASVAVLLMQAGMPVDHRRPPSAGARGFDVAGAQTEAGIGPVLARPPLGLTGLSHPTRAALHRVSRRFAEATVQGLATLAELTGNHLSERFREEIGLSLGDYIARVRVEVLKQRLCEPGHQPLDRLAEEVGFCHASHLSRVFTRYVHESPGVYRRNMQGDP